MSQLFNSMDAAPFRNKDLNRDAEEFIVSSLEEHSPKEPSTLRIHLEQWPDDDPSDLIREAVQNYFAYRVQLNQLEFRLLMKRGRTSLAIGSLFLIACLLTGRVLFGSDGNPWSGIARESLTIAGWVAMWRPMEVFLYDWWPLRRRGRIYARLSEMPVEVIPKPKR